MSGIGLLTTLQALGTGVALAPVMLVVLTGGLVGMSIRNMFDSILFDDEEGGGVDASGGKTGGNDDGSEGDTGMADGGLMAEEGGDFGDLGGLDEDGDGFGDDEFGEMDDASAGTDELEHRLDELENEVGSLSSTVNTVRTENEQISESVEDVQENVRKLLDIYEMVTRGVNPFADDIEAGMGGDMGDGGSFGLFDDEGVDGGGGESLDDDIATADAEGFFDEDLVDDGEDDEEFDVDEFDEDGDDVFEDDEFDEDDFDEDLDDDGGEGGKSFQELKDEYDEGDAEWTDDEALEAAAEAESAAVEDDEPADGDGLAEDELFDEVIDEEGAPAATDEPETTPTPSPEVATESETSAGETTTGTDTTTEGAADDATSGSTDTSATGAGKPYLAELPDGFAGDLIVVEWLEFLTERSSYRATDEAIDYYERIDWIDPAVASELREYLHGFESIEGENGELTIDDHTRSLEYISQLDGDGGASVALSKLVGGGGGNGLFG